jgi:hypothetical protein
VAETSHLRAEFRLSVVGHLVVRDLERGQLAAELKSLSAKKWKHPITGSRVTSPQSHQAGSSLPGETSKETLFVELPPASL